MKLKTGGNWIQTYTGRPVHPLTMTPREVDIRDIAHALSLINRFTGHTPEPYSVAQHSCLVCTLCREYPLWGLLHDAPEAYMADIARPVKQAINADNANCLKQIENRIMAVVCRKFKLHPDEPEEVKRADDTALANEGYAFFGGTKTHKFWHHRYKNGYMELTKKIVPWPWRQAEKTFLKLFETFKNGK